MDTKFAYDSLLQIRETHGCKGQPQEYYEYSFRIPKFVAQKTGDYWIVGTTHPDGVWRIETQTYPTADAARTACRAMAREWFIAHQG